MVIRDQQNSETPTINTTMHSLLDWRRLLPDEEAGYQLLAQKIVDRDKTFREASHAAVVPVKHTIKIEPAP